MVRLLKKIFLFFKHNSAFIKRILVFLIADFILIYQLPKEYKFKYEFTEGAPWLHENLIAPYNFPIYKLPTELKLEQDSVLQNFYPYYDLKNEYKEKAIINFKSEFDSLYQNQEPNSHYKLKDSILNDLNIIYNTGILSTLEPSQKSKIRVLSKNIATEKPISELYNEQKAYLFLKNDLEGIIHSKKQNKNNAQRPITTIHLEKFIVPNLVYNKDKSEKVYENLKSTISPTSGIVQKGEAIILQGQIISHDKYKKLESFKKEFEMGSQGNLKFILITIGQTIIITLVLIILYLFTFRYRVEIYNNIKSVLFILLMLIIEVSLVNIFIRNDILNIYILPFVLFPVLVKSFFDARSAIFYHTIAILLSAFLVPNPYEFILVQYFAGFLAILTYDSMSKRSQLFRISLVVFITYVFVYTAFINIHSDSILMNEEYFIYFVVSSLLLLLSFPFIYIFEKLFGFISDLSLLELADTNHILLRKMAETAPGTFQHSLQVANLAEEAVRKIRGSSLLVRVGALYHDIGKMYAPEFFTENKVGNYSPHDELSYEESAQAIIKHITQGVKMAEKNRLPQQVIDFIRTHHGTTRTEFFYRSFKNDFPDKKVNEQIFTYPGPAPFTKETAVLMMADSVEAASRSLKSYTEESIDKFVDKIIDSQMARGQFLNTPISFKQLFLIKQSFKAKLKNIYHTRIAYPEEKKE